MASRKRTTATVTRPNNLPERRRWHLDKTISVAHIVSVMMLVGGLGGPILLWGRAMEARMLTVENNQISAEKRDGQRDGFAAEQRTQMLEQLRRLEQNGINLQVSIAEIRARLDARPLSMEQKR